MEDETRQPQLGMVGCDRELFSRVWERVGCNMETAPVEVLPVREREGETGAAAESRAALPAVRDSLGSDEPEAGDVTCLGRGGADHGPWLQQSIRRSLSDRRLYQALSHRAAGPAARTLAAMAAAELRHARRLSAAYFLISGVRFLPEVPPHRQRRGTFWGSVREQFWAEQGKAAAYAAAAEDTTDPCLASLYRELAEEAAVHADLLRAMVERM